MGKGEHLPTVHLLRRTAVGEVDVGGRLLGVTGGDNYGVKQAGKALL